METPKEKAKNIRQKLNSVEFLKDFDGMDDELLQEISIVVAKELLSEAKKYNSERESFWYTVKKELESKTD